jgi:two-component system cell cycle sensor histidine kinase/response regulator CckA
MITAPAAPAGVLVTSETPGSTESPRTLDDRFRALSEAMGSFARATSDPRGLLRTVARAFVELLEAPCVVLVLSDDRRRLELGAVDHPDRALIGLVRAAFESAPLRLARQPLLRQVLESGRPAAVPTAEAERRRTTAAYGELLRRFGGQSLLLLPLRIHDHPLGLVILGGRVGPEATAQRFAENLADQAALAMADARLIAAERAARAAAERAREALRQSEEAHRALFEASPVPMYVFDVETFDFLAVNDSATRLYGYSRQEMLERSLFDLRTSAEAPALVELVRGMGDLPMSGNALHLRRDGSAINIEYNSRAITFAGRRARMAVLRDVTRQRLLEEQLRQAQKMEAIGRLAGGVAHDFNNLLTVILNYTDLALGDIDQGGARRVDLEEIRRAGTRAAELTRQLLMFSRQQVLEPRVLDLNEVLARMDKMLRRIVGEDIELETCPAPGLDRVRADPGSVEQLIMNLVVNARDAMPTGGRLVLETANVVLTEEDARIHLGIEPGPHVMLAVTDTGVGMDESTRARIFEPFFTTKDQGKGTGLGLSTVFGVVEQSGGSISVASQPGLGSTFRIHLPRAAPAATEERGAGQSLRVNGSEVILLVEDEAQVRAVTSRILREHGYRVIETRDAREALAVSDAHAGSIDLLLSDVVMPQMSGTELARRVSPRRPAMKILFVSGYTDDAAMRHGVLASGVAFLQKPLTIESLTRKVREVLDS